MDIVQKEIRELRYEIINVKESQVKAIKEMEDKITEQVCSLKVLFSPNIKGINTLAAEPTPRPKRARYNYLWQNFKNVNETSSKSFSCWFWYNEWPCGTHGQA